MLKSIEEVYYIIDEIVRHGVRSQIKVGRKSKLTMSEVITILIEGHKRHYITEKQVYDLAAGELRTCFKQIPCYAQFTRIVRKAMPHLDLLVHIFSEIDARKVQDVLYSRLNFITGGRLQ